MKRLAAFILFASALLQGCHQQRTPATSDLFNQPAQLSGGLPYPVLSWHPLNSSVDRQQLTISTLFGNDPAQEAAQAQSAYPQGAMLARVTWHEREDPHWFGARIPDQPMSVELLDFSRGGPKYRRFAGQPLTEVAVSAAEQQAGTAAVTAMKPIPLP